MRKSIALMLVFFGLYSSHAQTVLDTVVVTANRATGLLENATRTVAVFTEEEIKETPATTVNEILESSSALDVRQRGPLDVQADISVRGGTFDQTLILLNGIRMNDPQTGHHNMNLPITFDMVSQIEVLAGGAARVYGPNAFAGAINLQTPTEGENKVFVHALGGQNGLWQLNSHVAYNIGKWYTVVSGSLASSDGYINNTDFNAANFLAQTTGRTKLGLLSFTAGGNEKAFGAQDFYSSRYPEQFEATQTLFGSVKLTGGNKWKYTLLGYWRQHKDRFELFRETDGPYQYNNGYFIKNEADTAKYAANVFAPWAYYPQHNYHRTRVTGAEGQLKRTWSWHGTTTFGIDYRNEQIVSNNLGKPLAEAINIPNSRGQYTLADVRDNYAFYAEQDYKTKRWLFTAGALVNYNTAFGWDFMPGADLGFKINTTTLLYASIDRSFRLPTYTDLYYSLGGAQGSQSLQPEYSLSYELGVRKMFGNLQVNASAFRREGQNMIDWVQWKPDSVHAENLTEVNMNGATFSGNWQLGEQTRNWVNSVFLSYTFLVADETQPEIQSIYVLDYLQHKLVFGANHTLGFEGLTLNWRTSYQNRNGDYFDFAQNKIVLYKPFWLVDARLSYTKKDITLYAQANNLFNVDYVDRGNVAQPGLWLSGGIQLDLALK